MNLLRRSALTLALWGSALGVGYFGYSYAQHEQYARAAEQQAEAKSGLAHAEDLASAFRHVGKMVEPSVVNINVRKKGPSIRRMPFDDEMLRRFFPDRDGDGDPDVPEGFQPRGLNPDEEDLIPEQIGTGSGVIMEVTDGKGYILTNNHVAGGAEEMLITLHDGREITGAKLLGADAKTDLAVVVVEADRLSPARWGNSDELQKGDWIMAFGSPFNFVGSMTHGIVSALNRQAGILGTGGYENFIQVDAPINPGNSGGPLVNLRGEVVGINTAIASRSGGFQGVGFAIPSNQAKFIFTTLREKGKVVRGWLGVGIEDVARERELARSFGYEQDQGVLVQQVIPGTPATGRLKQGDIITEINGKPVETVQALRNRIAAMPPGADVNMRVFREGKSQNITLKLGEQPENVASIRTGPGGGETPDANTGSSDALGIQVRTLTGEMAERQGLEVRSGAVITRVDRNSTAAREGLRAGDVITEVGDQQVRNADEFAAAMKKVDVKKGVRLYVVSRAGGRYIFVRPSGS